MQDKQFSTLSRFLNLPVQVRLLPSPEHFVRSTKPGCCLRLFVSEKFGMRTLLFVCVATSLLVVGGCKERRPGAIVRDACNLLSKEEVESVQAAHVNETKSSEHSDVVFLVSP